jgi:hypothetical protein
MSLVKIVLPRKIAYCRARGPGEDPARAAGMIIDSEERLILHFLKALPRQLVCADCLAQMLGVTMSELEDRLSELQGRDEIQESRRECWNCGTPTRVFRAR